MALIFERIHIPSNLEIIKDFCRTHRVQRYGPLVAPHGRKEWLDVTILGEDGRVADPFSGLPPVAAESARQYLRWGRSFLFKYHELFPEVFETDLLEDGEAFEVELVEEGVSKGGLNQYRVRPSPMTLTEGGMSSISGLLARGYVPVVGAYGPAPSAADPTPSAKRLASLLAMEAVDLVVPATRAVESGLILEARDRLTDELGLFWAAMFRLTRELAQHARDPAADPDLISEARFLVDTAVRPSLLELHRRLELERKKWFHRILLPVKSGLRLAVGRPPITHYDLLTSALMMGLEIGAAAHEHDEAVNSLRSSAGLTFLLRAHEELT